MGSSKNSLFLSRSAAGEQNLERTQFQDWEGELQKDKAGAEWGQGAITLSKWLSVASRLG